MTLDDDPRHDLLRDLDRRLWKISGPIASRRHLRDHLQRLPAFEEAEAERLPQRRAGAS